MKKSLTLFIYWFTLFAVTLSGADVYSASKYESEPNENKSSATTVTFGDKMVGNMWHALDYDWYAVNVPSAGLVSLTAYYEFPEGSTTDTDVLYIELRDSSNKVLSDFFIDYKKKDTEDPAYIRDVNIPASGTYYIVAHCPSQAKFKRDRYYITMARGGGENAEVSILNGEGSISLTADKNSTATVTALVVDEDGNPVEGALVTFSLAFGDTIDTQGGELIFSSNDIDSSTGISKTVFYLYGGEQEMTFTYINDEQYVYYEGNTLITATYPSYFKAQLINATTEAKTFLFSTTEDNVTKEKVTKTIDSDSNYYLEVDADHGIWEVIIPNKTASTVDDEIGTAVTGADGKAQYTYKSTDKKGDFTVTASFGNSLDKLVIKQTADIAAKVSILGLVDNPDSDYLYISREYPLNVIVKDKNNNLVENGTEIVLTSSTGLTINSPTVKTESGMAKFTISSSTAKEYTLTASVKDNSAIKDTLTVTFNTISLSNMIAQPAYILADGKNTSTISVRLNDSNGFAVSGEPITFTTTCGSIISSTPQKTDDNGIAQATLLAPFKAGTCIVIASYGTAKLTTPVEFYGDGTGSATTSIELEAEKYTVPANGTSSVILTATLKDSAGEPVAAGTPVQFNTDKGMFPNGTQTFKGSTPLGGVIRVAILSKQGETGKANISCSSGGIVQSIQITFTQIDPDGSPAGESTAYINLTASPSTIAADGKSSLMVSAELLNSKGESVPAGTEIIFYAANGKFANGLLEFAAATTDDNGKVYVALISSTTSGPVDVWCLSNGVFQLTTVTFKGNDGTSDVGTITLTANPSTISANGFSSTSITAELKDSSGNPVTTGTSIKFTTNAGKFSNNSKEITVTVDSSGKIIVPLISDTIPGYAMVTASSGGATQSTLVTFEGAEQPSTTAYIELTAEPDKIPADGRSSLIITATLYDSTGKVMPRGTQATFTTVSSGAFLNGSTEYTVSTADDSGKLFVSLISSTVPGSTDIICKSNNVTQSTTVYFTGDDTGIGSTTSIELSASPTTIPADGASSSTITVTLKDSTGSPVVQGTSATLTTTLGTLSKSTVTTVDDTGVISLALTSGEEAGTARVVCTSNGITQAITVIFTGSTSDSKTPTQLALSLSQISVKTDNSDSTTITATVLDEDFAVIPGIPVSFTSDGGQLSLSLAETDENGQAKVVFSSGSIDKSNRIVNITAKVAKLDSKVIPVQVTGSTLTLSNTGADLTLDDTTTTGVDESNTSVLTITVKDAGGNPVYEAPIKIEKSGYVSWTTEASTTTIDGETFYKTDINGLITVSVKGVSPGPTGKINVSWFETTASQSYNVAVIAQSFGIVSLVDLASGEIYDPEDPNGIKIKTGDNATDGVEVIVRAPNQSKVRFATTMGGLDGSADQVKEVLVADDVINGVQGKYASVEVRSTLAGMATIEVTDSNNSETVDRVAVAFYRPSADAASILLQPSASVIAPSVGINKSQTTLTAFVKTSPATGNQAVEGVPVAFSIENSTGSGESVSPVVAYTNSAGEAETVFTAGSLGSDAEGVTVTAIVIGTTLSSSTNIVIGGTSGSVVIGRGAGDSIVILNPTTYSLFMSVLVSDLNGSPVPGANVSLSLWPEYYNTGVWYDYNDRITEHYVTYISGTFINEDINENTILDTGEDIDLNGSLTPPNSAAGNIPMSVTTNSDGYAEFSIIYLKSSARWIDARIDATTMVFGTEVQASMNFNLPAEKKEAEAGYLPNSSYQYVLKCNSGGTASFRLNNLACGASGTHTEFKPSDSVVGVAGSEKYIDPSAVPPVVDYYTEYDYVYTDGGSPAGSIFYDTITATNGACSTSFNIKIIIE